MNRSKKKKPMHDMLVITIDIINTLNYDANILFIEMVLFHP